jgi:hypothetical protein
MESKKVLIICYYWPPAGGPGVQRWLKFVKYLPEFGIDPIVFCPQNPNYPIIDQSLLNEVPKHVAIIKQPIKEPYALAKLFSKKSATTISSGVIPKSQKQTLIEKLMLYVRGNYFIPDARKNWVEPSVSFLSNYLRDQQIDAIITTGPPHSLHLIGLQLKQQFNLKWVADFRDPWTTIGYHKALKLTKSSKLKHQTLEAQVLNSADHIVVTSNHTQAEFKTKTEQPISVITNGYDNHSVRVEGRDEKFTLSHIGSLLSERNPKVLWEVLAELIQSNIEFASKFQLNLVGVVSEDVLESIHKSGLETYVNLVGYVSHDDAIKFQLKSRLLLLIEIDSEDTKAIIPGKLFEYLVSETPILAIGPEDSDIQQIITETNTGSYFSYHQRENLKTRLVSYFKAYQQDTLTINPIGLQKYSRKNLTKVLSSVIKI